MKKSLIVGRESKVLRQIAEPVDIEDIKSSKVKDLLKKMKEALHGEEDGVAIAAPQVGASLRIFIVNGETLKNISSAKTSKTTKHEDHVYINPEIIKLSKKRKKMEEGCLSVRWLYGQVMRSEKATVRAYDEHGNQFTKGASGLLAQIFQHEIDHLNGILFIDKAENVEDLPPAHKI
jgi:peptide deformylase